MGIGTVCATLPSSYLLAEIVKKIDKSIIVVLGGMGVTVAVDEAIQNPHVDFVVRGEGEQTMTELVEMLHREEQYFETIDGITFKQDGRTVSTGNRKITKDIDTLPYPAKHLMLYTETMPDVVHKFMHGDIITSRGCPFPCTFCAVNVVWGGRSSVSLRKADQVVEEMLHQKEHYGVQNFTIWDDLFTTDRKRVIEICNLLIEKEAAVNWVCYARVDTNMDPELLTLMKLAGCIEVLIGVESGSNKVLEKIKKGITVEQSERAAGILNEIGLAWTAPLMMGVPGETREEMVATTELLPKLKPTRAALGVFDPYPGTPAYAELQQQGRLNEKAALSVNYYYGEEMSQEEFHQLFLHHSKLIDEYNNTVKYGHPDSPLNRLISIDESLNLKIDFKAQQVQMPHWEIEQHQGEVLLWLGEGSSEGIAGILWAKDRCEIELALTVESGPGRPEALRRGEMVIDHTGGATSTQWEFEHSEVLRFAATLQPGENQFRFFCTDKATIREHASDTRPLLVLLRKVNIQSQILKQNGSLSRWVRKLINFRPRKAA